MRQIHLEAVDSTNNYLKRLLKEEPLDDFTYITAYDQQAGRGQMGNHWESNAGENITLSLLVQIPERATCSPFELNILASLALYRLLVELLGLEQVTIKWPNDILVRDRKIAGILVENDWLGNRWHQAIVGIGLNVWQRTFHHYTPEATSIASELVRLGRIEVLPKAYERWHHHFCHRLVSEIKELLEKGNSEEYWEAYHRHLYKIGVPARFRHKREGLFTGIIKGVNSTGQLEIRHTDSAIVQPYFFKEVAFLYDE